MVNIMTTLATANLAVLLVVLSLAVKGAGGKGCQQVMGQHAMDLRACLRIPQVEDLVGVMVHSKDNAVATSLQLEGILTDPQHVCSDKETFRSLFDCVDQVTVNCAKEEEKSYVLDPDTTQQGLDYFCQHVDGIDQQCYNQSYSEVFTCVKQLTAKNLKSNATASARACVTVDITHDCIHEHVTCDEKTRDLLLKYQDQYRKPKGCPAPSRSNRKKYITSAGSSMAAFVSKLFCICLSFCLLLLHRD